MFSSDGASAWFAGDPTGNVNSRPTAFGLDGLGDVVITGGDAHLIYPNNRYGTYKLNTNGDYVWTNVYPAVSQETVSRRQLQLIKLTAYMSQDYPSSRNER